MALVRLPGVVDVHTHMREPGAEHKEDFTSGTAAALAGGVTVVLAMPNTSPPVTDAETFERAAERARRNARCDYALFLGAAATNAPISPALQRRAAGLKIYVNETYGPLRVEHLPVILAHLRSWKGPGPVAVHAEGIAIPALAALAAWTGTPVHFCHISRAADLAVIRMAKECGYPVTCEVTPHHLWLTEEDARTLGPFGDMRPTLGTPADRDALWANLDLIDCIATDHAPHTLDEKRSPSPPPGVPGLETMLPLMLTAVHEGRLTLERLVELTHTRPREIFHLPPQPQTYVEVDLNARWTFPETGWHTRAGWSPFAGFPAVGRVLRTVLYGTLAYEDGVVYASAGTGRDLRVAAPVAMPFMGL